MIFDRISFNYRFALLQIVLVAGLSALYFDGYLMRVVSGESKYFVAAVLVLAVFGLYNVFRQQYDTAYWLANILVRIGVIGMIVGCSSGLTAVASALASGADAMKVIGVFLGGMGTAFYVSLSALSSNVWLETNVYLLRRE